MATVYLPDQSAETTTSSNNNKKGLAGKNHTAPAAAAEAAVAVAAAVPLVLPDGTTSTSNNFGFQMATTNPLFRSWVSSYDGKHPLLDVGCAYGINSLAAARVGAKVVALDMTELHLSHVAREAKRAGLLLAAPPAPGETATAPQPRGGVAVVLGSLPRDIPVADASVSSVLVAEVVHFLRGAQIEASLASLHRVLVPGGTLHITALSRASFRNKHTGALIDLLDEQQRDPSNRWPGEMQGFCDLINAPGSGSSVPTAAGEYMDGAFKEAKQEPPSFFHVFDAKELADAMARAGFDVLSCTEGEHEGYPAFYRDDKTCNVQVVGRKKLAA